MNKRNLVLEIGTEEIPAFPEPFCDFHIFPAGSNVSRGMIVKCDEGSRIGEDAAFKDFPRTDKGGIQTTDAADIQIDDTAGSAEIQDRKHLTVVL